jgi:hypothetical protein
MSTPHSSRRTDFLWAIGRLAQLVSLALMCLALAHVVLSTNSQRIVVDACAVRLASFAVAVWVCHWTTRKL